MQMQTVGSGTNCTDCTSAILYICGSHVCSDEDTNVLKHDAVCIGTDCRRGVLFNLGRSPRTIFGSSHLLQNIRNYTRQQKAPYPTDEWNPQLKFCTHF